MIKTQPLMPLEENRSDAVTAWRIRFVEHAPSAARVLRRFSDPVKAEAILEPVSAADLQHPPVEQETVLVAQVLDVASPAAATLKSDWLGQAPDEEPLLSVASGEGRIYWRHGRALVTGDPGSPPDTLLAAICEFAFYEAHLRELEQSVRAIEAAAPADTASAYDIAQQPRAEWQRMATRAKELALLRLAAARLEPAAYLPATDLPPSARRIISRLTSRSGTEERLEALSARLEACEDLYEGALDRIADGTWARKGNRLEIAIVILLLIEVLLIVADIALRVR